MRLSDLTCKSIFEYDIYKTNGKTYYPVSKSNSYRSEFKDSGTPYEFKLHKIDRKTNRESITLFLNDGEKVVILRKPNESRQLFRSNFEAPDFLNFTYRELKTSKPTDPYKFIFKNIFSGLSQINEQN